MRELAAGVIVIIILITLFHSCSRDRIDPAAYHQLQQQLAEARQQNRALIEQNAQLTSAHNRALRQLEADRIAVQSVDTRVDVARKGMYLTGLVLVLVASAFAATLFLLLKLRNQRHEPSSVPSP